jgi:putative tricarboxylic transport membrane protein
VREKGEEKPPVKRQDIIPISFGIALSILVMVLSYRLEIGGPRHPGPGFMPFYVSLLLLIVSVGHLIACVMAKAERGEIVQGGGAQIALWKIPVVVISLTVYGLIMEDLGFLISTFILVLILFKTAGMRRWSFTLLSAILTVLITYVVFTGLGLNFPKGILPWG